MSSLVSVALAMGLSTLGFVLVSITVAFYYPKALAGIEDDKAREKLKERTNGMAVVFLTLPATCVLFSFVIVFLGQSAETSEAVFFAVCLSMGLCFLMVSIGFALLIPQSIEAIVHDLSLFGKAIVTMEPIEVPILLTFVIAFLSLKMEPCAGSCMSSNYVMAASSFGAILGAAFARTSGVEDLKRRVAKSAISVVISFVGFIVALSMLGWF